MSDYGTPPPPPPPPPPGGYQQPGQGTDLSGAPLASWIMRVGAFLLDYVLVLPFVLIQTISKNAGLDFLMSLLVLAVWGYNRWYVGGQGQSFGKKQVGLLLLAESTGQPIGTGKAFLRDVCHILDSLACYIGWLFPLWDAKRQTFADKIMTTVVPVKS